MVVTLRMRLLRVGPEPHPPGRLLAPTHRGPVGLGYIGFRLFFCVNPRVF